MNIVNLFPTAVGVFEFEEKLTEEQLLFLTNQEKYQNEGNKTSKNTNILNEEIISNVKTFVEESFHKYFYDVINPISESKLRITQSWLNYSDHNEYHHRHAHPNSFLSGVFYVNAADEDKIYFYNNETYKQLKFEQKEFNMWNSESWWLPVITNQLIVFPSSLTHSVPRVEHNQTRISLAINSFPLGILGSESTLTELKL